MLKIYCSKRLVAIIVLILGTVGLSACGFQLRGSSDTDPLNQRRVALSYSPADTHSHEDPLIESLRERLQTHGVVIVDSADEAEQRLHIDDQRWRRRLLATGRRDTLREYQYTLEIAYRIGDRSTPPEMKLLQVETSQTANESTLLGVADLQELAHRRLIDDAVRQLVNRLGRALSQST